MKSQLVLVEIYVNHGYKKNMSHDLLQGLSYLWVLAFLLISKEGKTHDSLIKSWVDQTKRICQYIHWYISLEYYRSWHWLIEKKRYNGGGSKYGTPPKQPLFLCTCKESIRTYKKHVTTKGKTKKTNERKKHTKRGWQWVLGSTKLASMFVYWQGACWQTQGLGLCFSFAFIPFFAFVKLKHDDVQLGLNFFC